MAEIILNSAEARALKKLAKERGLPVSEAIKALIRESGKESQNQKATHASNK